jgi:spore coat polysaccharide biosynthesis predicted glycosyltransferase SpsG
LNNVTILTEAGKNIGFGHYTRCSSIYQVLKKQQVDVRFIVFENEYLLGDTSIESQNWLAAINDIQARSENEIVLVDSYLADAHAYEVLKKSFRKVIAIDDYNRISYPVDTVINPNVFFDDIDYSNQQAYCVGGKDYVILRPEFIAANTKENSTNEIKKILITIGGSDFRNILNSMITVCSNWANVQLTVIDPEHKIASNNRVRVLQAQTAEQMVNEMQQADVVIAACGQTLHELVALQKPTIGICLDIDQVPNQQFYIQNHFLQANIKWNDEDLEQKIAEQLTYFNTIHNRNKIIEMSRSLINKEGVFQLVNDIKTLYDKPTS